MNRLTTILGAIILALSGAVSADSYIGVDYSRVHMNYDFPFDVLFDDKQNGWGFQVGNDSAIANGAFGSIGYEVSYTDFGKYDGLFGLSLEAQAINAWLTASVSPVNIAGNPLRLEARAGTGLYKTVIQSGFFNDSETQTGFAYGLGVLVPLTSQVDLNLSSRWNRYDYLGFDQDPQEYRAGVRFTF